MVALYVRRLIEGTFEYAKVPSRYKAAVRAALEEKVEAGDISQEQFNQIVGEE